MTDIEGISEGRRQMALEKAEDARREWLRAERAEAEVAALRAEVERLRAALIHARGQMQHPDQMIDEALGDNGLPALGEGKKG